MIKHALSLYISLILAAGPVAAQVQEGAGAGKTGTAPIGTSGIGSGNALNALPILPAASAGLTATLGPTVSPVVTVLQTAIARPESLRVLATNPAPAAVYARALIASPVTPAVRAQAVKAIGEAAVAAIEAAVKTLAVQTSGSDKASASLKVVALEFAALDNRVPETLTVTASAPSVSTKKLNAPKRAWRALKTAAVVATMAITMAVTSPAVHAQTVGGILPNVNPISLVAQTGSNQTQGEIVHATDINDAIAKWTPNTRLIIMGNPGLDAGSQKALAQFLSDKHWTVIVAENASGMSYRDVDGNTRSGKEALEYGSGQGIFRKNGFSSQVDAASGLADGSILVISMSEHYLYLRNSEAQRVNGLDGAAQFPGNLDQWAKARLRAGGDISGAVKDTVTNIDSRLQTAVATTAQNAQSAVASAKSSVEDYARARAAFMDAHASAAATVGAVNLTALRGQVASAEKALANKNPAEASRLAAQASSTADAATSAMTNYGTTYNAGQAAITSVRGEVDALEKASGAFLKAHPKATGDLARPDIRAMREKLASAESALTSNPSGGKTAADGVAAEVRRVQTALNEHAAGADQIAASEGILKQLSSRERAGSASTDLVTAKQALREARESHDLGASTWSSNLQTAKSALANAERTISDADAAASRNALIALILKALLALGTLGTGTFLNWRARSARRKAEDELQKWDGILEKKLDTVIDELDKRMDVYVGPISGEKSRGWEEETAAAAAAVRQNAGKAKLYLAMARNIHDRATALVRPARFSGGWLVNQFWPSRFVKAEAMLATEPLTFKPADGFDALFEKASDWRGDLYGEAKDYAPVSENFESVMAKFNAASKAAVSALDEIEKASTGYGAAFDATEAAIKTSEARASQTVVNDYFKVPALGEAVLPAAKETLAAARAKAGKNPVGAMKGQGAEAARLAADALALAEKSVSMYQAEVADTDAVVKALAAASVATKWIADSREKLDKQSAKLAAALLKTPGAAGLAALNDAYAAHAANVKTANAILNAIAAAKIDAEHVTSGVQSTREIIAHALSLEAADMMREEGNDPSQRLAAAAESFATALAKLGAGDLTAADAAQKQGTELALQAMRIARASEAATIAQQGDVDGRIAEAQRLDALLPERAEILKSIKLDFAASTLGLSAGDVSHPNSNGTVDDNVDEAQAAIDAAKAKREKAVRSFRAAKVLEAASLLDQAKAHELIAQARLDEISEKRTRLDKAVVDNNAFLEKLEAKSRAWKAEIPGDKRSMRPTMKAYDAAVADLTAARAAADAKKGDPFKIASTIAAVSAELDSVWIKVSNDRDAYAEVVRSLNAAETQLNSASSLAKDSQSDGIADSPAITSALRELANLKSAYTSAVASSQAEHGEWPTIDHEADRITSEAAHVAASLKGELAAAARATQAISNAASQVREATNWTGSYGVSVPGSPGSGSLSSAKSALNNGDYSGAISYAESARSAAISAIQTAEAEVNRRRREEEERQAAIERERRRRQQEEDDNRRRAEESSRSSSSGSSGGGSSWGGSSSGGGSSGW